MDFPCDGNRNHSWELCPKYCCFTLEHIYNDQDPEFFVGKGIKPGIAQCFVEDIRDWVEHVKKAIPIYEVV